MPLPRQMEPLDVSISAGGMVRIAQPDVFRGDDQVILVSTAQVDVLCSWLQEVKAELEQSADYFPEERDAAMP